MHWYRVKTMLIILFFGVNVFLVYSMVSLYRNTVVISNEVITDTVDVLRKNNIEIEHDIIPDRIHDVSSFNMKRFPTDERIFAEKLMGANVVKEDGVYTFENKTLIISQDEFLYTNNALDKRERLFKDINLANAGTLIKKKLEQLDIKYANVVSVEDLGSGIYSVEFSQIYQSMEIFTSGITVTADAYDIISIRGCWMVPQSAGQRKIPVTGTGILIEFISNPNRADKTVVKKITLGYIADENIYTIGSKVVPAIPAWEVVTDNGMKYYYDALKGEYRY